MQNKYTTSTGSSQSLDHHQPQSNITAADIAARFPDATRSGLGWMIPCPCHTDDKPSLSVFDGKDGSVKVSCFAGCTDGEGYKDVKAALGIDQHQRQSKADWLEQWRIATYQHPDGHSVNRYRKNYPADFPAGPCDYPIRKKSGKVPCGKTTKHKHMWGPSTKGLYLLAWGTDAPGNTAVVCEGEKDAKACSQHVDGQPYTAFSFAGTSATSADFSQLAGRELLIWPDNDEPGGKAIAKIAESAMQGGVESIRLANVAHLEHKAGAADVDADTALELLQAATEYEVPEDEEHSVPVSEQSGGIVWAVLTERGGVQSSAPLNSEVALGEFDGMDFSFNEFTGETILNGERADDDTVSMLRRRMQKEFKFCPTREALHEGFRNLCLDNAFHPVRDFLLSLEWDEQLRLPTYAQSYFDADGDPLVNAAARLIPYGMVGRILHPGVKFDYAVVLQGPQGCGKSSSLRILAGPEFHGESVPLTSNDSAKIVIERTRGKSIIELAELAGWYYSEAESTKAMISAQSDSARLAYEKMTVEVLRQFIFVGTTNAETFLRDTTGNRRFPVVPCGRIDLQGLERDRDQILAEAVHDVQKILPGAITIPEGLFEAQAAQAEGRRTVGAFEEWLSEYLAKLAPGASIISEDLREEMKTDLAGTPVYPGNTEFSQVMESVGLVQVRRGKNRIRQWVQK